MNEDKRPIEKPIVKRKRDDDREYSTDVEHRKIEDINKSTLESLDYTNIRFDFIKNDSITTDNIRALLENLKTIKQELNDAKSLLSDKDIADWNRHTSYMNVSSTIVPYLREKLNIEIATQAWTKMYEILVTFDLINNLNHQSLITLHLCEAPGAFISALNHYLVTQKEKYNIDWQWYAQTLNPYYEHDESTVQMLIDDDRLIYYTIDDNHWDFGIDNSGNIMNEENIHHYISRFQSMEIGLITADGSFDVQDNPGEQEQLVYPLLKTEIYIALSCLMMHGNFIVKLFTTFEQTTIDLVHVLYRTFGQITMFKPQTSKKGNSEVYAICIDFDCEKFLTCFSDTIEVNPMSYSKSYLNQLLQCSTLFQSYQINTIKYNIHYFNNRNRRFNKKLKHVKDRVLNTFIDQCQVRELLPGDRHLLKQNLHGDHFNVYHKRFIRSGTFNDRHQIDVHLIRNQIQNGFFCLICSNREVNDLCQTCQIVTQMVNNSFVCTSQIYIGQLIANKETIVNCVFGKMTSKVQNSCFCNRYLLKLCNHMDLNAISNNENLIDLQSIQTSSSVEIPNDILQAIQDFVRHFKMELQSQNGIYYIQTAPILTRLQASIIYILTRTFHKTSVYVVPSLSSSLLFIFEQFQNMINREYELVQEKLLSSETSTLLQFVHLHQLLDQNFAFNLIQANNICLELRYVQEH